MLIAMVQFPASYFHTNIIVLSWHIISTPMLKKDMYPCIWMSYEAWYFAIVVHFCPKKSHSTKGYNPWRFHDFGSKFNRKQNGHQWNASFMLIAMVQIQLFISFLAQRISAACLRSLIPRPSTPPRLQHTVKTKL